MRSIILHKNVSYRSIGICMEVHNTLKSGLLEILYKDALEYEFRKESIKFTREKEYAVQYKEIILPHRFYADFVVEDTIILEVKSKIGGFADSDISQCLNYLQLSGNQLCLLVNFGRSKLEFKRIVL